MTRTATLALGALLALGLPAPGALTTSFLESFTGIVQARDELGGLTPKQAKAISRARTLLEGDSASFAQDLRIGSRAVKFATKAFPEDPEFGPVLDAAVPMMGLEVLVRSTEASEAVLEAGLPAKKAARLFAAPSKFLLKSQTETERWKQLKFLAKAQKKYEKILAKYGTTVPVPE